MASTRPRTRSATSRRAGPAKSRASKRVPTKRVSSGASKRPIAKTEVSKAVASKPTSPRRSVHPRRNPKLRKLTRRSLRWAAQFGILEDVKRLLDGGADPDYVEDGCTPLGMACFHKHVAIVRALLAAGADPGLQPPLASAPIVYAATSKSKRRIEMIRMLLDAGADPDPDGYGGLRLIEWCRRDPRLADVLAELEAAAAQRTSSD